jgi:hypothetical protein
MDHLHLEQMRGSSSKALEKDPWATEGRLVREHKALQVRGWGTSSPQGRGQPAGCAGRWRGANACCLTAPATPGPCC